MADEASKLLQSATTNNESKLSVLAFDPGWHNLGFVDATVTVTEEHIVVEVFPSRMGTYDLADQPKKGVPLDKDAVLFKMDALLHRLYPHEDDIPSAVLIEKPWVRSLHEPGYQLERQVCLLEGFLAGRYHCTFVNELVPSALATFFKLDGPDKKKKTVDWIGKSTWVQQSDGLWIHQPYEIPHHVADCFLLIIYFALKHSESKWPKRRRQGWHENVSVRVKHEKNTQ